MDSVIWYFGLGVLGAIVASIAAARLLKLDSLHHPSVSDLLKLIDSLKTAAAARNAGGVHALATLAQRESNPTLRLGFEWISAKLPEVDLRNRLDARFKEGLHRGIARMKLGRFLSFAAPAVGIAGMTGAMFLALGNLKDPTQSAAGLAIAAMVLMVGANVINVFVRRIPKNLPDANTHETLTSVLVIEGLLMVHRGESPEAIGQRLTNLAMGNGERPIIHAARAA